MGSLQLEDIRQLMEAKVGKPVNRQLARAFMMRLPAVALQRLDVEGKPTWFADGKAVNAALESYPRPGGRPKNPPEK